MTIVDVVGQREAIVSGKNAGPLVIACDWQTLPETEREFYVAALIHLTRFEAAMGKKQKAYVVLTNVRDKRDSTTFRDDILDAYDASVNNGNRTYQRDV